jgi:hypothetical protein
MRWKEVTLTVIGVLGWAGMAMADVGLGRQDNSGFVVWAFLAFCALIVVAQLLPAIRSRILQRAAAKQAEEVEAPVAVSSQDKGAP